MEGDGTRFPLDPQGCAFQACLHGPRQPFELFGESGAGGRECGCVERRFVAVAGHELDAGHGDQGSRRGEVATGDDGDMRNLREPFEGGKGGGRDARVLGAGNDGGQGAIEVAGDQKRGGSARKLAETVREGRSERHAPSRAPRKFRPQAWASCSRTAATSRSLMRPGRPLRA